MISSNFTANIFSGEDSTMLSDTKHKKDETAGDMLKIKRRREEKNH